MLRPPQCGPEPCRRDEPSAAKVWRKLEVEGGLEGILARRPVTAHPQGYLYDLWLIERIAEQLGV